MPIEIYSITALKAVEFKDGTRLELEHIEANTLNLKFKIEGDLLYLMRGFGDYAEKEGDELIGFKIKDKEGV